MDTPPMWTLLLNNIMCPQHKVSTTVDGSLMWTLLARPLGVHIRGTLLYLFKTAFASCLQMSLWTDFVCSYVLFVPFYPSVLGDTTFEVFTSPPTPDLLKVKVLICEATYIDDDVDRHGRSSAERAQERGHCHLLEFCEHEHLFQEVEHIILVHMSDKYSPGYIKDQLFRKLPQSLENKVLVGNFFKETL